MLRRTGDISYEMNEQNDFFLKCITHCSCSLIWFIRWNSFGLLLDCLFNFPSPCSLFLFPSWRPDFNDGSWCIAILNKWMHCSVNSSFVMKMSGLPGIQSTGRLWFYCHWSGSHYINNPFVSVLKVIINADGFSQGLNIKNNCLWQTFD